MNKLISTPISVVMSIYKEPEKWLRESINSILNQSFENFEFIIINDLPDRELNNRILNEYKNKDCRIRVIQNEKNIGLTKSLNKGLCASKGKYILRQDADDISKTDRLKVQYDFMEGNPDYIVCGSHMYNFDDKTGKKRLVKFFRKDKDIKLYFLFKNAISHPTVILRRYFFIENQIFYNESPETYYAEDMVLWIDIIDKATFHNIQKPLVYRRVSHGQITKSKLDASNKAMLDAAKRYFESSKNGIKKGFKQKRFYAAAGLFFKNQLSMIDYFKMIFKYQLFLYPRLIFYILKKHNKINFSR